MARVRITQATIDRLRKQGRVVEIIQPEISLPASWPLPMPPSVNKLFVHAKDRKTGVTKRYLTDEARAYRRMVQAVVKGAAPKGVRENSPDALLEVTLTVRAKFFNKGDGKVKKKDATNRIKFLEDCVCAALGYDDAMHWRFVVQKSDSDSFEGVDLRIDWYRGDR